VSQSNRLSALPKLSAQTLAWATDWDALFGRRAPIILEIGFGFGAFLAHLARTHLDANIVGLEVSSRSLESTERLITRERLSNVRVIHTRAETALHHLFRPAALADVHINFPDPWFKQGHIHRRLMQRDTLTTLVSRMTPGARLYLATDIADYATMSDGLLSTTPGLENALAAPYLHDPRAPELNRVVTKYEDKAQQAGRTCYYFVYWRTDAPAPNVPVIEDLPMPHVVFASPLPLDAMIDSFEPIKFSVPLVDQAELTHISFIAVYTGQTRRQPTALFEVHLSEPTIEQRIALMLLSKSDLPGAYTLQLGSLGHARPTTGVHWAVRALSDWLISLHPDAHMIDAKLQGVP